MKRKLAFLLIISLFIINGSQAQDSKKGKKVILKGLVFDTENNPVQNASVFIDGKNTKVLSDAAGQFELKLNSNVKTITVFTLTQGTIEVVYQGEEEMTFVLDVSNEIREDSLNVAINKESDMVNMGYVTSHQRNLTTSVSKVRESTVKNADQYQTIYDMLRGESGVMVNGTTVRIRGIGTLGGGTNPLYVVNGMPVSSIDHISPSQVKSISVLKDSAAAIYGIRGANGVIVITLKSFDDK